MKKKSEKISLKLKFLLKGADLERSRIWKLNSKI